MSAFDEFMANNSNPSPRSAFDAGVFAARKHIEKFRSFDDKALKKASEEGGGGGPKELKKCDAGHDGKKKRRRY